MLLWLVNKGVVTIRNAHFHPIPILHIVNDFVNPNRLQLKISMHDWEGENIIKSRIENVRYFINYAREYQTSTLGRISIVTKMCMEMSNIRGKLKFAIIFSYIQLLFFSVVFSYFRFSCLQFFKIATNPRHADIMTLSRDTTYKS